MADATVLQDLAVAETSKMSAYLATLPKEVLDEPSACHRWTIGDVVAHLALTAESYAHSIGQLREKIQPPVPALPLSSSLPHIIAQQAIDLRQQLGGSVVQQFQREAKDLSQLLLSLTPRQLQQNVLHFSGQARPVARFPLYQLTEMVIHGWDIRSRLGHNEPLSPQALPFLVDRMPGWLTGNFRRGEALPSPLHYRFELSAPVARTMEITIKGDKCDVSDKTGGKPQVVFFCHPEAYILLNMGRLDCATSIATGALRAEGDHELACRFRQWFGSY